MLLIVSTSLFGMASNGGGLPGVVGQASGDSYRPFTDEPHSSAPGPAPCGPGNECNRETLRPERLTTPPQPEPTVIELPTTGSSCKECAKISEDAAAHIVAATLARCQERCEARKGGVRRRLDAVNEEIQKLQAQQLAQSETLRQREELRKYHELLQQATTFAPGQTAQSALAEAQTTREQLKQQNQQMEEMRKTITELRAQVRANEDPGGAAAEPMGMPLVGEAEPMGPYRFQM